MTQDTANDGFDIGSLDTKAEATFDVAVIVDVDGNAKSGFTVVGKNSDQYRAAAHQLRVDGLQRASKRKAVVDTSTAEGADSIARTIEANDLMLASSVVVGWFGFSNNGVSAAFNAETAKKMLAKMTTWRQKVLEALENDANFIKG